MHIILFIKFGLDLVIGILFLCMNVICCISFCLTKMMQTVHIICLVTQISKKLCVLVKLKLMALNACSCPAFLIYKPPSLLLKNTLLLNYFYPFNNYCLREKEEGEYFWDCISKAKNCVTHCFKRQKGKLAKCS